MKQLLTLVLLALSVVDYARAQARIADVAVKYGANPAAGQTFTHEGVRLYYEVYAVDVLGWSDGGIQALLLAIRHPAKVKKIAVMGAALNPTGEAVYPEVIALVKSTIAAMPTTVRATPQGRRELKVTQMLLDEPNIQMNALEAITAPTLVMAGDHDLIRDEHTVEIYHHIPQSQLAIFPNATHMVPFDDPASFNTTVERFFRTQFVKKDRIMDLLKSVERMRAHPAAMDSNRGTRPGQK